MKKQWDFHLYEYLVSESESRNCEVLIRSFSLVLGLVEQ